MTPEAMQRLAEAVAWCNAHIRMSDLETSTRSVTLRPPAMELPERHDRLGALLEAGGARDAVDFVCEARRRELVRLGIPVLPVSPDLAGGRILFTTIDTDLCGASTMPSNGYYDDEDLPGWDTWFFFQANYQPCGAIFCWVPNALVELADEGMWCIPVDSVQWAAQDLDI